MEYPQGEAIVCAILAAGALQKQYDKNASGVPVADVVNYYHQILHRFRQLGGVHQDILGGDRR